MKIYNRAEINAILKKAAENSTTIGTDSSIGLSFKELQKLASDTGIDPNEIIKAIAELELDTTKSKQTLVGGPFSFSSQVLTEGEISDAQWEEMLISIRDSFRSNGEVSSRKSVYEWSSPKFDSNSAKITAFKNEGKTKISLTWNGPLTAIPFYIPIPIAAIISLLFASGYLGLTAVPGFAFAIISTGLTFLAGRWALGKKLNKVFKHLRQTLAELEIIARNNDLDPESTTNQLDSNKSVIENAEPIIKIPEEEGGIDQDINSISVERLRE
tara:strand:- start:50798 stop:51610 length:813 start_codon:yes stop_codon:yes gene_type:complete